MLGRRTYTAALAAAIAALLACGGIGWAEAPRGEILEPTGANEFDVIATLTAEPQWTAGAQFEVKIDDQDPERGYLVRVEKGRATVLKRNGRSAKPIGVSGPVSFPEGEHRLSVKRRETRLLVLVDGQIAARAYDHAYGGGEVSYSISGEGLNFSKVRYQPIDDIYFAEDFVRTSSELAPWEPMLGSWRLGYLRVSSSRAANAFWCVGQADGVALTVTGHPFWDNYSVQAAVRPTKNCGAIGLAFCCQDAKNYLAFRWTADQPDQPGKREIVQVVDGKTRILASAPGGFTPSEYQWYRLRVNVSEGAAVGLVDGITVVYAPLEGPGEGKVGLYAVHSDGSYFDDVLVRSYQTVCEDFEPETFAAWERRGKWSLEAGDPPIEKAAGEATAFYGFPHWADYQYMVDVLPGNGRPVGVYFNRQGPDDYYLYRSSSAGQELVRVLNGHAEKVDSAKASLSANHWHTIQVRSLGGHVRLAVDGEPILEDYGDGSEAGGVGLYVGPKSVAKFRRLRMYFAEEPAPDERIPERFKVDPHMREWATAAGDWLNPNPAAPGEFWRRGDFYDDLVVEFPIEEIREQIGSATVALAADGKTLASGYRVIVNHAEGADHVTVQLYRESKLVREAKGALPAEGETTLITRVERRGKFVAVNIADEPVLRYADSQPLIGSRVGFTTDQLYARINEVIVTGSNQLEHTFNVAPVYWMVRGGVWGVQPRYGCDPRWSFYGGYSKGIASVWHKRPVKGDVTFDVYAAIKMDLPGGDDYGARWRDINLTICSDGEHLNSGYTLIYGGWHNSYTRLLRCNEVVAETNKVLVPNKDQAHREWMHVTLEKKGQHIVAYVGNQVVFEYTDPQPLEGEYCAIWTRDNGIMVARANLYYQHAQARQQPFSGYSEPELPARTPARYPLTISSSTHPTIANDFEVGLGQVGPRGSDLAAHLGLVDTEPASGHYCLAAINACPAGDFAINLRSTIFDAARLSRLSFDYRFPKDARINLYLQTGDRESYAILMTGKESAEHPTIGKVTGAVADGAWHHAQIDLAQCLAAKIDKPPYKMRALWLASRSAAPDLRWYGFGSIPGGTRLYLDNFALRGAGDRTVTFEWSALPGEVARPAIPAEVLTELEAIIREGGAIEIPEGLGDDLGAAAIELPDIAGGAEVAADGRVVHIRVARPEGEAPRAVAVPIVDGGELDTRLIKIDEISSGTAIGIPPPPPVEIVGYSYVFDQKPDTEAPEKSKGSGTSATFTADRPGLWYLHLRGQAKDGTWGDTCHLGVLVE